MAYQDPWTYTNEPVVKSYRPLSNVTDLDALMDRIGDAKYVLLGEASHGTHEYYTWRMAMTKRLIEEKGFSFVAVEGDWPDCYEINRYIKDYPDTPEKISQVLLNFRRWPSWMWANWETAALAEWMKNFNKEQKQKVGFYGLDVYSLWESMNSIVNYLNQTDPQTAKLAKRAFACFEPYGEEGQQYAKATKASPDNCEKAVQELLTTIRQKATSYNQDPEAPLNTEQNAMVTANAEKYYRLMMSWGPEAWNMRDIHMTDTLDQLMKFHGPDAKAIVWEHNTHIGDARATNMSRDGMVNVGQLVRERHSADGVVLVGFGAYKGEVVAGRSWGAPMEVMPIPEAKTGSVEEILHRENPGNKLLIFEDREIKNHFNKKLGHRAIGVVYHPERDAGNYVSTILPSRYDAFLYFENTRALHPLHIKPDGNLIPETYPFAF
ncbi:erythromycin esterase family protein [Cytophagaceae bacterium ABcell3]|nr:erythromycin esterase family protein [Cytophagaceae bacterium ABcell3]